ncbi:MAG: hypothetical protein FJ301_03670 [Planctomycetes bacterium]|nr:hypothetical protein [Planctomycetota bacterium]
MERLIESPGDGAARLELIGDRVVVAAVPVGEGLLPPAARTAIEAIAPGGAVTFAGFESGPHGSGWRVEKRYAESAQSRSALVTPDGGVLERWHTVSVREVPTDALRAVTDLGATIDEARIVSGPGGEERWTFLVRDRMQRRRIVDVSLRGELLTQRRRLDATVDA